MSKSPRTPSHPPTPAPDEPRDSRAQEAGVPGASFYPSVMDTPARKKFARARKVQGLNDEIALLRLRLRDLLAKKYARKHPLANRTADHVPNKPSDPALDRTIDRTIEVIVRAYGARTRASKDSPDDAAKAISNSLRDVALDLGMDVIPWKD